MKRSVLLFSLSLVALFVIGIYALDYFRLSDYEKSLIEDGKNVMIVSVSDSDSETVSRYFGFAYVTINILDVNDNPLTQRAANARKYASQRGVHVRKSPDLKPGQIGSLRFFGKKGLLDKQPVFVFEPRRASK
jgi:hypothetical protein